MSMLALALRALLLRERTLALALLPLLVGSVAVGVALSADPTELEGVYATLGAELLVSVVIALTALVLGTDAFGDERDNGTLPLLMATATPRWRVVGAKIAATWVATVTVCLPAVVGVGVLGGRAGLPPGEVWTSLAVTTALAGAGYVGLFVLLSLLSARSLLVGLAYVLVWEGLLAGYATALRNLSVGAYGRRILGAVWDDDAVPFSVADTGPLAAAAVLLALAAVTGVLAARRLPHVDATG